MTIHGTSTETLTGNPLSIVSWDVLKAHLRQNGDDDNTLIETYLAAAVSYCEQYLNRCLVAKTVTMYYHAVDDVVSATLQLRYQYAPNTTFTIKVVTDGVETTHTGEIKLLPDQIYVDNLPAEWQMITVSYTPALYADIAAIIPAILMKVGEMYSQREDGPVQKAAIHILNRHRIKRRP
jgi:hypothetical protein